MTTYYKATAPDGRSFASGSTGRIDYAAALASGEVIRHPAAKKVRDDAGTYLSASVEPADCTGFRWPCRLFRVEPVGRVSKATVYPNKRCVSALRVVEELPAWQALGPNGQEIVALIERCRTLTADELGKLDAAWAAAWGAARAAAWAAASDAAWGAALGAAWAAAWDAAWGAARDAAWAAAWAADAAWAPAWGAARDAALALCARDLITPDQFDKLTAPWVSVMGKTWEAVA